MLVPSTRQRYISPTVTNFSRDTEYNCVSDQPSTPPVHMVNTLLSRGFGTSPGLTCADITSRQMFATRSSLDMSMYRTYHDSPAAHVEYVLSQHVARMLLLTSVAGAWCWSSEA